MNTKSLFLAVSVLAVMMLAGCEQNQPGGNTPAATNAASSQPMAGAVATNDVNTTPAANPVMTNAPATNKPPVATP
jgi:hypothetical protein